MSKISKTVKATWEKSIRLNNRNRDNFVTIVLEEIMPKDDQPTQADFAKRWSDKMYDIIYTSEIVTAMRACPSWMVKITEHIFVNMIPGAQGSGMTVLAFKCKPGAIAMIREEDGYSWSHYSDGNAGVPTIDADHAACKEFALLDQSSRDWARKKSELRTQLKTVTDDCNTSHQLYEAWPGALKYAKQCFEYMAPTTERKTGGTSSVTAQELEIGIMMSKASVGAISEN